MTDYDTIIEKFTIINKLRLRIIKEIESHMKNINFTDFVLLKKISRENRDLSMTELSELTGFSNTLITFTVDSLEKKGYVYRQKGEDRRTYYIKITDRGKRDYEELENTIASLVKKNFANIAPEDMQKLDYLISELNNILHKYLA